MYRSLVALSFASLVFGQQVGTNTAEKHPSLPIEVCTAPGSCTKEDTTVVLDVSDTTPSCIPHVAPPTNTHPPGQLALDARHRRLHQLLHGQLLERDGLPGRQDVRGQLRHRRRRVREDVRHHDPVGRRAAPQLRHQERQRRQRRLPRLPDGRRGQVQVV